jgi:hypothetical protein
MLPPDDQIGSQRSDLVAQAALLIVTDQASADRAGKLVTEIRALLAEVKATFDPVCDAAHTAHKVACGKRAEHADPLLRAERALKDRVGTWALSEERKRREEAARQAAEARKRDEEARLAEAQALADAGEPEEAERVLVDETLVAPPAPVAPMKVAGVSVRPVWKAEVTNLRELLEEIVAGRAPITFVEPAAGAIQKHTAATDGKAVPKGVRAWQENAVAARGVR